MDHFRSFRSPLSSSSRRSVFELHHRSTAAPLYRRPPPPLSPSDPAVAAPPSLRSGRHSPFLPQIRPPQPLPAAACLAASRPPPGTARPPSRRPLPPRDPAAPSSFRRCPSLLPDPPPLSKGRRATETDFRSPVGERRFSILNRQPRYDRFQESVSNIGLHCWRQPNRPSMPWRSARATSPRPTAAGPSLRMRNTSSTWTGATLATAMIQVMIQVHFRDLIDTGGYSHDSSPPTHQSPIGRFSLPVFLWIEAYSRGCSKSAQQQSSNMYSDMMTVIRHYLWKMKASLSEDLVEVCEVNDSMGIDQIKLHFSGMHATFNSSVGEKQGRDTPLLELHPFV